VQCLEFAVQLGRHYEKLRAQNVEVLVVGGGPATRARAMAQHSRVPFPVLADPDRSVYLQYNLSKKMVLIQQSGTFLVDRDCLATPSGSPIRRPGSSGRRWRKCRRLPRSWSHRSASLRHRPTDSFAENSQGAALLAPTAGHRIYTSVNGRALSGLRHGV
jgi:hypothetical protein